MYMLIKLKKNKNDNIYLHITIFLEATLDFDDEKNENDISE